MIIINTQLKRIHVKNGYVFVVIVWIKFERMPASYPVAISSKLFNIYLDYIWIIHMWSFWIQFFIVYPSTKQWSNIIWMVGVLGERWEKQKEKKGGRYIYTILCQSVKLSKWCPLLLLWSIHVTVYHGKYYLECFFYVVCTHSYFFCLLPTSKCVTSCQMFLSRIYFGINPT